MKIRTGFVSNSSSSSFVITGIKYTGENIINEIIKDFNISQSEIDDICKKFYMSLEDFKSVEFYTKFEMFEPLMKSKGFDIMTDENVVYIGTGLCYSDSYDGFGEYEEELDFNELQKLSKIKNVKLYVGSILC